MRQAACPSSAVFCFTVLQLLWLLFWSFCAHRCWSAHGHWSNVWNATATRCPSFCKDDAYDVAPACTKHGKDVQLMTDCICFCLMHCLRSWYRHHALSARPACHCSCAKYYKQGARFAKWRAVLKIGNGCPSGGPCSHARKAAACCLLQQCNCSITWCSRNAITLWHACLITAPPAEQC